MTPYKVIRTCRSKPGKSGSADGIKISAPESTGERTEDNRMKFKRTSAALLAAVLAVPSVGIYADAAEDEAMKTELTYVKQRIDIPKEYSEFSYRTSTEGSGTRYNFTWEKKDSTNGERITVSIVGKVIKSVYIGSYVESEEEWKPSFAKLSDAKLIAAAKKYINEINPTITDRVKTDDDSFNISLYGNEATLRFKRVSNDIDVTGQTGTVTVNKNTGELIRYNFNWINGASFSDTKGVIPQEKAQTVYKELFPSELVYTLSYDWEKQEQTPHLIYRQTKNGQINAFTGELSKYEDYDSYDVEIEAEDECADVENPAAGANKAVTFTQEEIEKLEKEDSLIKADKELDDLKKQGIFYIPDNVEVTYQYCNYNERLGYYIRNVEFSGKSEKYIDLNGEEKIIVPASEFDTDDFNDIYGNFSYNAETGEVTSFYCWAPDNGTSMKASASDKKAKSYMKKILGDERMKNFGDLEMTSESKVYDKYDQNTGKGIGNPRITSKNYRADRMAYDIRCDGEYATFTLSNNGFITIYNLTYYADITYPKPDNIIGMSEAYQSFFKQVDLGLKYRCAYNTKSKKVVTALVYAADSQLYIDAFTGKRTNYDGSAYDEAVETGDYTDLAGSKYKAYAEKLKKYGITLMDNDGKLNEKAAITAGDFNNILRNIGFYNSETTYKEDASLRRQDAAKILVTGKYGKDIAEMTSIFRTGYSDVKSTSKYIGYIAIADASGLLKGSNGKYRPTASFTRGAALKFVYDYLSR